MVPLIETARLRLRAFRHEDLDDVARLLANDEVMRYVGGDILCREEAWRKMIGIPGLWLLLGYGYWAVERRHDGAFIGQTGFADFKRDMHPNIEGIPEMGWMFLPEAQGQGYAAEAAGAALQWADDVLKPSQITAIIDVANQRSIRLARRLGFSAPELAQYRDEEIYLLRRASSPATAPTAATAAS